MICVERRYLALIFLGAFALAHVLSAHADRLSDPSQEVIQNLRDRATGVERPLAEEMARLHVPAVSMAVIDGGRVAWTKAWGFARTAESDSRNADPRSLFQAASVSKILTAIGALTLVDSGKLNIDEDVDDILSGWKLPKAPFNGIPVTTREILSHSAGISVHGFPGYRYGQGLPTLLQILNGVAPSNSPAIRVETKPHTKWQYSGGGYVVLQQIIVQISKRRFPEFMKNAVLNPLGMTASSFEQPLPASTRSLTACGHDKAGTQLAGCANLYPEEAAAGLWTTPAELAQVVLFLQAKLVSARPIIAGRTRNEMLSRQMADWGLGIGLRGDRADLRFWHSGSNEGFKALLFGYAHTGQGAVIMANGDQGVPLIEELLRSTALVYKWPTPNDLP